MFSAKESSPLATSRSAEQGRLYSNPGNRGAASTACPRCWLEGRSPAEHVERLRFDWGTVFRARQVNRYRGPEGASGEQADVARQEPECVGRKVAISNRWRRALAGSYPSIKSTQRRDQYTKRMSPRGVECSSVFDMARTLRRSSRASWSS